MKDFSTPRYRAFSRDNSSMQVFANNEIPVLWEMFSFLGTLLIRRLWKRSTSPRITQLLRDLVNHNKK